MSWLGLGGRRVMITGCNNPEGVGAACAEAFLDAGARVALVFGPGGSEGKQAPEPKMPGPERYEWLNSQEPQVLLARLSRHDSTVHVVEADLRAIPEVKAAFDACLDRLGSIDVLVNNAAVALPDSFLSGDGAVLSESLSEHVLVNASAPAELMRRFIEHRTSSGERPGGAVVNVSTDASSGHAGAVSYGASKAALESLTRAAAWEAGRHGIRINAVAPGPTQTGWIPPEERPLLEEHIPLGRLGTPSDVAELIVFLASDRASWITGQIIHVGGGNVMP